MSLDPARRVPSTSLVFVPGLITSSNTKTRVSVLNSPSDPFIQEVIVEATDATDVVAIQPLASGLLWFRNRSAHDIQVNSVDVSIIPPGAPVFTVPAGTDILIGCDGVNWEPVSSTPSDVNPALSQANWVIDPVNGNDGDEGDAISPLQTFLEFAQRVRGGTITVNMLVTILSTPIAADRPELCNVFNDRFDHQLRVKGTPAFGAAQPALTAVTPIIHGLGGADKALYLTAGVAAWQAGTLYVIVGGARDGAVGWCAKDMGGGQGRFSNFALVPDATLGNMVNGDLVTPQVGDVLHPVTLCTFSNPLSLQDANLPLIFENIKFGDDSAFTGQSIFCMNDNLMTFTRCDLVDLTFIDGPSFPAFNVCGCDAMFTTGGANAEVLACVVRGVSGQGLVGAWRIDYDTIFQGCTMEAGSFGGGFTSIGDAGFYDIAGANSIAVLAGLGANVQLKPFLGGSSGEQYGTGDAGFALGATEGGQVQLANATKMTIAAAVNKYKRDSDNGATIPLIPNSVGSNICLLTASAVSSSGSQAADQSTNSAAFVDLPGVAVTLTPRCTKVRVSLSFTGDADAAADVSLQVLKAAGVATDANGGGKAQAGIKPTGAGDTRHAGWIGFVTVTPNTAVTFKVQWKTTAGNARMNAATNIDHAATLIVEEVPYT